MIYVDVKSLRELFTDISTIYGKTFFPSYLPENLIYYRMLRKINKAFDIQYYKDTYVSSIYHWVYIDMLYVFLSRQDNNILFKISPTKFEIDLLEKRESISQEEYLRKLCQNLKYNVCV